MANNALARIESALRERKLDRTLTTALAPLERSDAAAFIPFGVEAIETDSDGLRLVIGGVPVPLEQVRTVSRMPAAAT